MKRVLGLAALAAVFAGAGAANADEVFIGVAAHDVSTGVSEHEIEPGPDVDLGYNSAPITGLSAIGRPMINFEYLPNTQGRTSFGSIGFIWRRDLIRGRLYGQIGLGGALHDQATVHQSPYEPGISAAEMQHRLYVDEHFKAMGSRFLFHPSLALGWRMSPRVAVEAVWDHFSNAGLGRVNPGMDIIGGRLVFRFGPRTR
jgi:hypothetical protein